MANPNPKPPPEHARFKPGQSGNPCGANVAVRLELKNSYASALFEHFKEKGAEAIERVWAENPRAYLEAIAEVGGKDVSVQSNHTVTHRNESISATAEWVANMLTARPGRTPEEPVPEGPVLSH